MLKEDEGENTTLTTGEQEHVTKKEEETTYRTLPEDGDKRMHVMDEVQRSIDEALQEDVMEINMNAPVLYNQGDLAHVTRERRHEVTEDNGMHTCESGNVGHDFE